MVSHVQCGSQYMLQMSIGKTQIVKRRIKVIPQNEWIQNKQVIGKLNVIILKSVSIYRSVRCLSFNDV